MTAISIYNPSKPLISYPKSRQIGCRATDPTPSLASSLSDNANVKVADGVGDRRWLGFALCTKGPLLCHSVEIIKNYDYDWQFMAVPVSELKKSNIIPIIRQFLGLEILLLLLSSIDYDSIPMRFLCELSTKNYCVQLLEGCTCGHLVYLPTSPPPYKHHLSSYLWEFTGIRFAIGFYLGLQMHFNKKFHWKGRS